ncbi:MAG: hypothetical protein ABL959_10940 [Pyrinomonadaceae bacterium]
MKRFARALLLLGCVVSFGAANQLQACSCVPERPICESVGSVKAIFVGKAIGSKEPKEEDGHVYDVGEIYFEVTEAFVGIGEKTKVTIRSGTGGGDCGYWFRRGGTYLIYAYGDDISSLGTNICSRTRRVSEASEDLDFLRKLPAPGSGIRIFGSISEEVKDFFEDDWRQYKPVPGVRLSIQQIGGAKRKRELVTDADGKYEVKGLPAGQYQVLPTVPRKSKTSRYGLEPFEVRDRGCRQQNFVFQNDSRIVGRLVDAKKRLLKDVWVELIPAYGPLPNNPDRTTTDDDGAFEFDELPVGSYILAVNLTSAPDDEAPFPTTYFPNTASRAAAMILEVRAGQTLDKIEFQMPEQLAVRTVRGIITWPDGSPAAEAEVHLEDLGRLGWCVNRCSSKADKDGKFALKAYEGRSYRIRAEAKKIVGGSKVEFFAAMPTFAADQDRLNFNLVLTLLSDPAKSDEPD